MIQKSKFCQSFDKTLILIIRYIPRNRKYIISGSSFELIFEKFGYPFRPDDCAQLWRLAACGTMMVGHKSLWHYETGIEPALEKLEVKKTNACQFGSQGYFITTHFISWFPDFPSLDFISWFYLQLRFYFLILLIFNTAFCKFRFYFLISWFPDFQLSIFQLSNFPDFQVSSFFTFQDFQVSHFLISKCFLLFHISDIFNLVSCRHQQKYILLSWFHLSLIVSSLSTIFLILRS